MNQDYQTWMSGKNCKSSLLDVCLFRLSWDNRSGLQPSVRATFKSQHLCRHVNAYCVHFNLYSMDYLWFMSMLPHAKYISVFTYYEIHSQFIIHISKLRYKLQMYANACPCVFASLILLSVTSHGIYQGMVWFSITSEKPWARSRTLWCFALRGLV